MEEYNKLKEIDDNIKQQLLNKFKIKIKEVDDNIKNQLLNKLIKFYSQKQLEEFYTEQILIKKQWEVFEKKKKIYENQLKELDNPETQLKIQQQCTEMKKEIVGLQNEEQKIQTKLLPYLKFKTASSNIKPTQFYDLILNCSSLMELLEQGWRIQLNQKYTKAGNLQELIDTFNNLSYQIGIIGDTNIGKSFFLSQICAKKFKEQNILVPTGMAIQTKGLSVIKFEFEKGRWLDLLDSKGFHAPIQCELHSTKNNLNELEELDQKIKELNKQLNDSSEEQKYNNDLVDILKELSKKQQIKKEAYQLNQQEQQKKFNDRQVTEKLIQNYIIKSSSMIIIMVGDLSLNEQILIEQVMSSQEQKPIIIIHNLFKIQTYQQLLEKINTNINQSFQVQEQTYVTGFKYYQGLHKIQNIVKYREIFHIPFGFQATDELLEGIKQKSQLEYDEFSKIRALNEGALQFLQDKINFYSTKIDLLKNRSLTQSLKDYLKDNISDYLDLNLDKLNPNYYEYKNMLHNINFETKKKQLLYSNQLIYLYSCDFVNLRKQLFSNELIYLNSIHCIDLNQNCFNIHPKYSLLTHKVNNKKVILVWIEMPPVSEEDISRILKCTTITKDNESYILRICNFERNQKKLFELFNIKEPDNLKLTNLQAFDKARQYKTNGIVEIDIKLCQIRQMKVHNKIDPYKVQVIGGIVKFEIECEDLLLKEDESDCFEDLEEEYFEK